jgi:hypothetical protein
LKLEWSHDHHGWNLKDVRSTQSILVEIEIRHCLNDEE